MTIHKQPEDIADEAARASWDGDHRGAERLYLLAAARGAAYTNQPTRQKKVAQWDKAASRERRLAELTKGSGGGNGSTPTQKPLPDWASGSDGLTFVDHPKLADGHKHSEPHTVSDRPFTVESAYADIAAILGNVERVFGRPASHEIVKTLHREREES
jgi:hypothetical protein